MFENFDWIEAMRSSPVMLIILGCSVLTFGFAIERALYFWKRRGDPDARREFGVLGRRGGGCGIRARVGHLPRRYRRTRVGSAPRRPEPRGYGGSWAHMPGSG